MRVDPNNEITRKGQKANVPSTLNTIYSLLTLSQLVFEFDKGPRKPLIGSKVIHLFYLVQEQTKYIQLGGFLPLLYSKLPSIQDLLEPIEIRSTERPSVQLEVVQFEGLLREYLLLYKHQIDWMFKSLVISTFERQENACW